MCRERKRTRDRLLEYDFDLPLHPRAGGLAMVYPWEDNEKLILRKQIYDIAVDSGFAGTEEEFWNNFSNGHIIFGKNPFCFPVPGNKKDLYYSESSGTVYCFKELNTQVVEEHLPTDAIVVGVIGDIAYTYIPIRAMLLEHAVIFGGEA